MLKAGEDTITSPARRALLAGAGVLPIALTVGAAGAVVPVNPDAELLATWDAYVAQWRRLDLLVDPDAPEHEADYDVLYSLMDRIEAMPARTPAGMLVKLRHLFHVCRGTSAADRIVFYGVPAEGEEIADRPDYLLWSLIQDAERMVAQA